MSSTRHSARLCLRFGAAFARYASSGELTFAEREFDCASNYRSKHCAFQTAVGIGNRSDEAGDGKTPPGRGGGKARTTQAPGSQKREESFLIQERSIHLRQCVGSIFTRFLVEASIHSVPFLRTGNISAWIPVLSMTQTSKSASDGAIEISSHFSGSEWSAMYFTLTRGG